MSPRFSVLILPLLMLSLSLQAAPWYRVEVILVAYQDNQLIGDEHWPDVLPLPQPEIRTPDLRWWHTSSYSRYNALLAGFGFPRPPAANWDLPMQPLPNLQLKSEAARIQQVKGMKVIWHQAWVEPIQEQERAIVHPLDIRLSDQLDVHLSGSFSLHRSRFLHISTDLVVQHFEPRTLPALTDIQPQATDIRSDYRTDLLTQAAIEQDAADLLSAVPVRAAHIRQSRRMRSGELHYIDHPLLGVVVRVVPVTDAQSL